MVKVDFADVSKKQCKHKGILVDAAGTHLFGLCEKNKMWSRLYSGRNFVNLFNSLFDLWHYVLHKHAITQQT